jgi:hypothetical protein
VLFEEDQVSKQANPNRTDIYQTVTGAIISALEAGTRPWMKPWNAEHAAGRITRPLRANGQPYGGVNGAPYRREKKEVLNGQPGLLVMACAHRTNLGQKWLRPRKRRRTTACPEKAQSVEAICGAAGQGKTCMAKAILPEPQFAATYTRSGAAHG